MDPDPDALRQRLSRAARVLTFAQAAGDESAIRIAAAVLADLQEQAGKHGIEPGTDAVDAACAEPGATGGSA